MPGALVLSRAERTIKKDLIKNTSERLRLRTKGEQSKEQRAKSKVMKKIFRFAQDDSLMILCHFSGKPSTTRLNGVKNL